MKRMEWQVVILALALIAPAVLAGFQPGSVIGQEQKLPGIDRVAVAGNGRLAVCCGSTIHLFDPAGQAPATSFTVPGSVDGLAADGEGLAVLTVQSKAVETVYMGRKVTRNEAATVICRRYSGEGKETATVSLSGLKRPCTVRIRQGEAYVSDFETKTIRVFDLQTGAPKRAFGQDIRLCCGVFDFDLDPASGEVVVANLGAFQVQRYGPDGKLQGAFGKRGEKEDGFLGCCNPAGVLLLPDGRVCTGETGPYRFKVFHRDGRYAETVELPGKLDSGCARACMTVDAKGNLYVGANEKGRGLVRQYVPGPK